MRSIFYVMLMLGVCLLAGCYMATTSEEYFGIQVEGKTVLFLLDTSGSMESKDEGNLGDQIKQKAVGVAADAVGQKIGGFFGGLASTQIKKEATKLGAAKRQLIPAVRGLAPDVTFNLLMFGGAVKPWKPTLVEASGANTNAMLVSLQTLTADGGTPAFSALEQAFQVGGVETIFFLSDGLPTDKGPDAILRDVRQWNANNAVTINTVGVGDDQDENFLCQLAVQNNGVYIRDSVETCRAEPKPAATPVASPAPVPENLTLETPLSKSYTDAQGNTISLSHGDLSFADAVVSFEMGQPGASGEFANPELAVGIPDYDANTGRGAVALGCGGTLIVQFTDNALIDIDGPDLHLFEVGPDVEPTLVAISRDGATWIDLGTVSGGQASIDIAPFAEPDEAYYFVKLTDARSACSGDWPGADVDAVAAIGTGERISLRSAILFDFDKFDLKPEARAELDRVAARIQAYQSARVVISGHTDSEGSIEYNQELSEKRARSVQDYLTSFAGAAQYAMQTHGYGELRPVATNDTEEGREQNRRVEILILPAAR